jgi:hypothetical protein
MFQLIIISAKKKRSENDKCAFNLEIIFVLNEKRKKKEVIFLRLVFKSRHKKNHKIGTKEKYGEIKTRIKI